MKIQKKNCILIPMWSGFKLNPNTKLVKLGNRSPSTLAHVAYTHKHKLRVTYGLFNLENPKTSPIGHWIKMATINK